MTWFLLKGLLRDRNRSVFPLIVIAAGVSVTILLYCFMMGFADDMVRTSAKMDTGHVKIMSRAYAEQASLVPNDLALSGLSDLLAELRARYPEMEWTPRIKFGGLLDVPDEQGETRAQGPVFGLALDLLSPDSSERDRLGLDKAIIRGRAPQAPNEILVSDKFAQTLGVKVGEMATLIGATANGGMAIHNFIVAGTIRFGVDSMDRNAMLADVSDVQYALDMEDGAGEVLGFFPNQIFNRETAERIAGEFNQAHRGDAGEFAPVMLTLRDQNGLGELLDVFEFEIFIAVFAFVFIMSIVLWNTGLMSGLRRYGEMGVRLAFGEAKSHVYWTLINESVLIAIIGSVIGTAIGLGFSFLLQEKGLDVTYVTKGSDMLMSNVMRAKITPFSFTIGFIPGFLATLLGSVIAGLGIFRRQTSQLFKELET